VVQPGLGGTGAGIVVGVDLGGTKIAAGLVTPGGQVHAARTVATPASDGADAVVACVIAEIEHTRRAAGDSRVTGVGVATPGIVAPPGRLVFATPALPGWGGVDLAERIEAATGLPTTVRNDGQAAAWGEWRCGAGRRSTNLVMLTLGTGVGGGIVSAGRLLEGGHGAGGRLGHLSVDDDGILCWCGARGCLEQYASGTAIARAAGAATAREVIAAARRADARARDVVRAAAGALSAAIATLVNVLDPEVIVIGGGVAQAAELFLDDVVAGARRRLLPALADGWRLAPAELGGLAAVCGAGLLAREHLAAR
jgi:glucokinase